MPMTAQRVHYVIQAQFMIHAVLTILAIVAVILLGW